MTMRHETDVEFRQSWDTVTYRWRCSAGCKGEWTRSRSKADREGALHSKVQEQVTGGIVRPEPLIPPLRVFTRPTAAQHRNAALAAELYRKAARRAETEPPMRWRTAAGMSTPFLGPVLLVGGIGIFMASGGDVIHGLYVLCAAVVLYLLTIVGVKVTDRRHDLAVDIHDARMSTGGVIRDVMGLRVAGHLSGRQERTVLPLDMWRTTMKSLETLFPLLVIAIFGGFVAVFGDLVSGLLVMGAGLGFYLVVVAAAVSVENIKRRDRRADLAVDIRNVMRLPDSEMNWLHRQVDICRTPPLELLERGLVWDATTNMWVVGPKDGDR